MSSTIKVKPDELADVIVKELQTYKQEVADDMLSLIHISEPTRP